MCSVEPSATMPFEMYFMFAASLWKIFYLHYTGVSGCLQLSQQKKRGHTPTNDQGHPSHQQHHPQDEPGVQTLPLAVCVYGLDVLVIAVRVWRLGNCASGLFLFGMFGLSGLSRTRLFSLFLRRWSFCGSLGLFQNGKGAAALRAKRKGAGENLGAAVGAVFHRQSLLADFVFH